MGWMAIGIGFGLVVLASVLLYVEFQRAVTSKNMKFKGLNNESTETLVAQLDKIDTQLDEINAAFYEVSNELEGEISLHSRDIRLMEERLSNVEASFDGWKNNVTERLVSQPIREPERVQVVEAERTVEPSSLDEQKKYDREVDRNVLREEVIRLRATGMNLPQIAKTLNVGLGEIQLVMNLKRD